MRAGLCAAVVALALSAACANHDRGTEPNWRRFYVETEDRAPRPLLLEALARFEREGNEVSRAVDAGCGSGIAPGGRFAGHFFGLRDDWASIPDRTHLSREQVEALFRDDFEIDKLEEVEEDRMTVNGTPKHWHKFHVIARKRDHQARVVPRALPRVHQSAYFLSNR